MHPANSWPRIVTDEAMMETQSHGTSGFPFQYYLEDIWEFDFHMVDWHWHPELEIACVREGSVRCFAGGETLEVKQGEGLLINSRIIHRFEAGAPNQLPNIVFLPNLLAAEDSLVYRQYIQPVLAQAGAVLHFRPETDWHAAVLGLLGSIFEAQEMNEPNRLTTLRLMLEMWELLHAHVVRSGREAGAEKESGPARLQAMMAYIHAHYSEPVTLENIAASVFISKNSALQLFQRGIRVSPVAYLLQYRLKSAARLLGSTEKPVSAIAEETGFRSASYFCRRFRELFGCTPMEYRQRRRGM